MEMVNSDLIGNLSRAAKEKFEGRRTVMSFSSYLLEVQKKPAQHLRHSAQYFSDLISHFGMYSVSRPMGQVQRLKLFDALFDQGEGQVLGQERVQNELLKNIQNFVRAGRSDKLVLLHGPNGSAKTSILRLLARAAEIYSEQDEGALYRFNWVFPIKVSGKAGFGFNTSADSSHADSYANLPEDQVEAKVPCELNDHPILLLDAQFRRDWLKQLIEEGSLPRDYPIGDFYKRGDLSSKNKKIFQALLTSYRGDVAEVLKHVQVERFYLSQRYHVGLSSVEPQMSVDAQVRQLTMDQSVAALPSSLKYLSLYETSGPIAEANRGLIEYNDLLKRPIEAWKYLLVATELSQVSVGNVSLFFDALMMGSSNEVHLQGFREYPDWQSFKGRIELVRVPYLMRYQDELKIYQTQIPRALHHVHIAPLALEVAARWAVLTRLEAPRVDRYPENVRELVKSLTPAEKLDLYDIGATPERLTQKEAKELRNLVSRLYTEFDDDSEYEGKHGASPREMRTLILSASQDKRYDHLSPIAILEGIQNLTRERSSYEFLRRETVRGFRDAENFIEIVKARYLADLNESIRVSIGLLESDSHKNMLERYIKNVSAWIKREKLYHPVTQKMVDPDAELMLQVERVLMAKGEPVEEFRRSLISQIAAQKLEQPESDIDYAQLFHHYLKKLKDDYYAQQRKIIEHAQQCFLALVDKNENQLDAKDKEMAQTLQRNLHAMGYNDSSARNAMAYLSKNR